MATQYDFKKPAKQQEISVKAYCSSCWKDRPITNNNKCFTCGSRLVIPRHWDTTTKKLELIYTNKSDYFTLEILGRLYFVPHPYLDDFIKMPKDEIKSRNEFVEKIKMTCSSIKV